MSKKILYWGPYSGHVGTIKAQINSAYSMVRYGKHRVALVRVHSEFHGYEGELAEKNIRLLDLGLSRFFPGLEKSECFARRPYMLVAAIFGFIPFMFALQREKPDMVIMNLVVLPVLLACVLSRQKMIKVVSVQGYPQFLGVRGAVVPVWKRAENRLRKFLWALVYPRADYILTMTEGTRTKLLENTSLDSSQVRVVNNAVVDDKVLSGRSSPVPHEWYCKDVPLVVGVGRLTRQKGFDVLVDAMYKLHQLGLEARLIIVGEGEERDSLQNQIDRTGQAEKIKLVGHQNNPYPFIAHADLFVLSSRWEDPGHAIIEAAALRVPIVTTDCPSGPSDLVGNGEGGWICENANADDMADKIKLALENPDDGMLAVSAENADQYTLESHFRALELLFRSLLMETRHQLRAMVFLPSVETGGVERNAILVANYLADRDVDVELVYTRAVDYMLSRFDDRVIRSQLSGGRRIPFVHQRISDAMLIISGFIRLLRKRKREQTTVILSFQSNIVSIVAGLVSGVPIIARVSNHPSHAVYAPGKVQKLSEKLKRFFYRYADCVVTNAEVTSQYYREILPVNVETIYNPVDVSRVRALASEDIDHQWLMEKHKKVVVSVGRLAKQKNFPLLLKAFSRAVEHVDACLIILGEGSERARLEQLVDELGLAGRVDLPGYKKNVQPYVARSDLFVLSSDFEGMPNALLEAVAVGVPVVSTDCLSGPAEILQQGEGGLLVPVGDAGALSDAIVNELKDVSGAISRQRVAAEKLGEFEYQRIMQKYEDLLKKVAYA